jgi:hypothetical protein
MAEAVRRIARRLEYACVLNTILALLAVAVVMAAHGVAKLVLLPFRALRGLFRHGRKPAQVTVS